MVHCNAKVILIDFHVLEDKTYSFFIEDELCELQLTRKEDRFHYDFKIDKEADTPLNQERRERERKYWWQTLAFVAALLLAVGGFFLWWQYHERVTGEQQMTQILEQAGSESVARVVLANRESPVGYAFVANGRSYQAEAELPDLSLSYGLPLETGDEFVVRYANRAPRIHEVDFSRPTQRQVERYRERVLQRHARLHPELRPDQVACQVQLAFDIKGLAGLADLYFQKASSEDNPDHNERTYLRLVRDLPFRKGLRERCY